jgi:hypothetical protein
MQTRSKKVDYKMLLDPFKYRKDLLKKQTSTRKPHAPNTLQKKINKLVHGLNRDILSQFVKKRNYAITGRIQIDQSSYEHLADKAVPKVFRENHRMNDWFFEKIEVKKKYDSNTDICWLNAMKVAISKRNGSTYRPTRLQTKKTATTYWFRYEVLKFVGKEFV